MSIGEKLKPDRAMRVSLLPDRRGWLAVGAVFVAAIVVLVAMGRPPICPCGTVRLWQGVVQSPENSQQISDWYSFSHLIHGLLFYGAAHLLWRKAGLAARIAPIWALAVATGVEAAWEVLENSPVIIDRYRAVTVSWGYSGDSILNSASDIGWMVLGWGLAWRLPVWGSFALGLGLEVLTLLTIRDNLTLNIVMLVWPIEAIRVWQAG